MGNMTGGNNDNKIITWSEHDIHLYLLKSNCKSLQRCLNKETRMIRKLRIFMKYIFKRNIILN